jgi:hypothetical protein
MPPPFPFTADPFSQIELIYIAYFNRAGDPGGQNYWDTQLIAGNDTAQAQSAIAASYSVQVESQGEYPFLANPLGASQASIASFLNSVYENLFDRPADAGAGYWQNQINAAITTGKPLTIANAIGAICLDIAYGAQNTAVGQDQTVLANKVAVPDFLTDAFASNNVTVANGNAAFGFAHTVIASVTASAASVTAAEVAIVGIIPSLI